MCIRDRDGSTWSQLGIDINGEAVGDRSGYSVSLNSVGDRVAIGAILNDGNGSNSGHTRIYELENSIVTGDTGVFKNLSSIISKVEDVLLVNNGISTGWLTGTTGTFTGAVSGTTGTFTGAVSGGAVSGTTGTFTGDVSGVKGDFTGRITGFNGCLLYTSPSPRDRS